MVAAILRYFVARLRYRIKMFSVSLIISKLTSSLRSSILNSVLRHRDGNRNESRRGWVSMKSWNPPIIIAIFVFSGHGLLVAERDWWHRSRRTNVQILLRFVKRKNNDARQAGNLCIARFRCGDQPLRLPLVSRYHPFSPCFRRTRFRFRVDAHVRHLPFLYSPLCHPLSLLEPLHSPSSISLSLSSAVRFLVDLWTIWTYPRGQEVPNSRVRTCASQIAIVLSCNFVLQKMRCSAWANTWHTRRRPVSINFALKLCRSTVEIILFDVPLIFLPLDFPFVLFFIFLFVFFSPSTR